MTNSNCRGRGAGFTLIEMMIVITIISVLLAIAVPSYRNHITKSSRAVAKARLMDLLAVQEQYFVNHRGYATQLASLGYSDPMILSAGGEVAAADVEAPIYSISIQNATAAGFELQAAPAGKQVVDTDCGTLIITSTGAKSVTGDAGAAVCW